MVYGIVRSVSHTASHSTGTISHSTGRAHHSTTQEDHTASPPGTDMRETSWSDCPRLQRCMCVYVCMCICMCVCVSVCVESRVIDAKRVIEGQWAYWMRGVGRAGVGKEGFSTAN
jgi:hypothetical protein